MKEDSIKEKFILLRGEGLSFDKIAKRIKVSKPTLIAWQKEFGDKIKEIEEMRFEEVVRKYDMIKEKRIERISKELDLVWKAYEKIDYSMLSKRELLMMFMRLNKIFKDEVDPVEKLKTEEKDNENKDYKIWITRQTIGEGGKVIEESEPRLAAICRGDNKDKDSDIQ
jgi:hypothetical protein